MCASSKCKGSKDRATAPAVYSRTPLRAFLAEAILAELGCQATGVRASGPCITSGAWAWLGWVNEVLCFGAKNMA